LLKFKGLVIKKKKGLPRKLGMDMHMGATDDDAPLPASDPVFLLVAHGQRAAVEACLASVRRFYPSATVLVRESGTRVLEASAARFACEYAAYPNLLAPGPRSSYAHFHAAGDLAAWLRLFLDAAALVRGDGWVVYLEPDVLVRGAIRAFPRGAGIGGYALACNVLTGGRAAWVRARRGTVGAPDLSAAAPRYGSAGGCCLHGGRAAVALGAALADIGGLFAAGDPWHGDEVLSAAFLAEGFAVVDWWSLTEERHERDAYRRLAAPLVHDVKYFYAAAPVAATQPAAAAAARPPERAPPGAAPPPPRVRVFTVATDAAKTALYAASASLHGVPTPTILGLDGPWRGPDITKGPSGGYKFVLLRAALEGVDGGDLVVFTDAYDVYWNAPLPGGAALAAALAARGGCEVLFAAEVRCWPGRPAGEAYPRPTPRGSPYAFLNSGCFVGYARAVRALVAGVDEADDDQRRCHDAYVGDPRTYQIDGGCGLWQCLGGAEALGDEVALAGGRLGARLENARFGTTPCAVHGNGGRGVKRRWDALARHHLLAAADGRGGGGAAAADPVRCRAICLAARPDRWAACARRLAAEWRDARIVPAVDGRRRAAAAGAAPRDAAAVEAALGCGIYGGWAVYDERSRAAAGAADAAAYEAWFADAGWPARCVRGYVDFHGRHVTLGEIGCALSHVEVWAANGDAECLVVLEDDARCGAGLPAALAAAAAALRGAWDLVYLHSANYAPARDEKIAATGEGWRLREAGHRKLTTAYAVSRRGLAKLNGSGFRRSLFSVDDFLPALYGAGQCWNQSLGRRPARDIFELLRLAHIELVFHDS